MTSMLIKIEPEVTEVINVTIVKIDKISGSDRIPNVLKFVNTIIPKSTPAINELSLCSVESILPYGLSFIVRITPSANDNTLSPIIVKNIVLNVFIYTITHTTVLKPSILFFIFF